jgi:hypothetical protein
MSTAVYPILANGLIDTITSAMQAEPVDEWSPEAVEEAVSLCRQARRAVQSIRDDREQALQAGQEAKGFVAQNEPLAQILSGKLAVFSRLVEEFSDRVLTPRMKEFVSESQALAHEATDLHSFLEEALAKAKAPPRPIDWNRVQAAEAASARGETKPFQRRPQAEAKE